MGGGIGVNAADRIRWHCRMTLGKVRLQWGMFIHHKTAEDIMRDFDAKADSIPQEEKDDIERLVREQYEKKDAGRPHLDPRRTMLIRSRRNERRCNALTAPFYRRKILKVVAWAQQRGITAFMTDYYTPLGLLALETLLELRKQGANFRVYAVRSCYFGQRRTYRLVRETGVEMAFLPSRADYSFHDDPDETIMELMPCAWTRYSEEGIWIAKNKVPSSLLEAWRS